MVSEREVHERIKPMVARVRRRRSMCEKNVVGEERSYACLEVLFRTSPRISEQKRGLKIASRSPKMNDHRTISQTDHCPRKPVQRNIIRPMIRDVPKKTVSTASLSRQLLPGFDTETSLFLHGRHGSYSLNSSRRRLVCWRLTGTSVLFLSFIFSM